MSTLIKNLTLFSLLATIGACKYETLEIDPPTFASFSDSLIENAVSREYKEAIQSKKDYAYLAVGELVVKSGNTFKTFILVDKYDRKGNRLWTKVFGNGTNGVGGVRETVEGSFVIAGYQDDTGYALHIDSKGESPREHQMYPSGDHVKIAFEDIDITPDGRIAVVAKAGTLGQPDRDILLVMLEKNGTILIESSIKPINTYGTKVIKCSIKCIPNGGYAVAAAIQKGSGFFGLYVKLNASGVEDWHKSYESLGVNSSFFDVTVTDRGEPWLIGFKQENPPSIQSDIFLATPSQSSDGKTYTFGTPTKSDAGRGVAVSKDGSIALTGYETTGGARAMSFYRVNAENGVTLFQKPFEADSPQLDDTGYSIVELEEGGYLIAGYTTQLPSSIRTGYIVRINPDGTF